MSEAVTSYPARCNRVEIAPSPAQGSRMACGRYGSLEMQEADHRLRTGEVGVPVPLGVGMPTLGASVGFRGL